MLPSEIRLLEAGEIQSIHRFGVLVGEEPGALLHELLETKPIPAGPPVVPVGVPSDLLNAGQTSVMRMPM